ncbi:MAG: response regulator transcription factor [Bdellovibrionales bacterium]|nr:response regulator transcription factor [Bdellovibrionales bacterium]
MGEAREENGSNGRSSDYLIAVIEDEPSVRSGLTLNLELEGFRVVSAVDGEEGLEVVRKNRPDVIILDVMMPKKNGLEVCRDLRNAGDSTPLILLTAKSQEVDKVLGLELGADDYLAKPFGMRELVARVRALLRRTQTTREIDTVQIENVVIDFKAYKAERDQKPIELSAREYRLLRFLVARQGAVVTRDELLDEVWGYNSYPSTRTVDNHIAKLRQKIEPDSVQPRHILTVHGVGYKFVA